MPLMWPLLWQPFLPKFGRVSPAVEVQFLLYFLCTFLCPNFHCTFGIQWMLQLQWMYSLQFFTVLSQHCIFVVLICSVLLEKVFLLLWGFSCHNTLFQLFSALLTIFFFQFPIKFIDVFCYLQIWVVWLQRLEEMISSQRGHISMHNVKVCFPNCLLPPY